MFTIKLLSSDEIMYPPVLVVANSPNELHLFGKLLIFDSGDEAFNTRASNSMSATGQGEGDWVVGVATRVGR